MLWWNWLSRVNSPNRRKNITFGTHPTCIESSENEAQEKRAQNSLFSKTFILSKYFLPLYFHGILTKIQKGEDILTFLGPKKLGPQCYSGWNCFFCVFQCIALYIVCSLSNLTWLSLSQFLPKRFSNYPHIQGNCGVSLKSFMMLGRQFWVATSNTLASLYIWLSSMLYFIALSKTNLKCEMASSRDS